MDTLKSHDVFLDASKGCEQIFLSSANRDCKFCARNRTQRPFKRAEVLPPVGGGGGDEEARGATDVRTNTRQVPHIPGDHRCIVPYRHIPVGHHLHFLILFLLLPLQRVLLLRSEFSFSFLLHICILQGFNFLH